MALVRQLCTPSQELAVKRIAEALSHAANGVGVGTLSTAEIAELARRFGLPGQGAEGWARGSAAVSGRAWPESAVELVGPEGLFEEIGLDDTVAVVDRLARAMVAEPEPAYA